ncbi:unnamed protein product [Effrenium voratum]|uniref:Uncharacterized protein n=1 Tax=Effrenium voratum TaxID=2562239 RepID=A0AA36MMN2_9DINO|nr:unnamed protein product [Effrenium voratum]
MDVGAYLKDALAVLLEVRPANPHLFLLAYFQWASHPESLEGLAWYLLKACPRTRDCFQDHLHTAYTCLKGKSEAASHQACEGLLQSLAAPLPITQQQHLLRRLRAVSDEGGRVGFRDFCEVVEECILQLDTDPVLHIPWKGVSVPNSGANTPP